MKFIKTSCKKCKTLTNKPVLTCPVCNSQMLVYILEMDRKTYIKTFGEIEVEE